ncbi:MAG: glycoside hydrolase family 9 protein [Gemmatimonadaceae bacterium]
MLNVYLIALHIFPPTVQGQGLAPAEAIRINQVGFYPAGPKVAVVADARPTTWAILSVTRGDTVLSGHLSAPLAWPPSGEVVRQADFSRLTQPGTYVLAVSGVAHSHPFPVSSRALREVARASLKSFYYQRASTPLAAEHAGRWSRPAGHPDTAILVHASAASPGRPAGTRITAPRGWYDAGDYNKYVVNSGISTYTLLTLVEDYPTYAASLTTKIPETGNGLPDVLNEAMWNLRWLLAMQDPGDGGVYHKLTNAEFDRFVAPHEAVSPRYVVQKSTGATLDFAAVAAHAAVVARRYPVQLPGLADSLTRAARHAWTWARQHPDSLYDQPRLNLRFTPAINTGAYGDRDLRDEFQWAAAELYLATREDSFFVAAGPLDPPGADVPGWPSVRTLGLYSLLAHRRDLSDVVDTTALAQRLISLARDLKARADSSAYGVPMVRQNFVWGSNAIAASQGNVLLHAFHLSGDSAYLRTAVATLDYLLGRNATGYSFVTGHGAKTPQAPHHRPSSSDSVAAPVPGLLVGGPNPGRQDRCAGYPSLLPALAYLDAACSYASNEVAINWNAPLTYLAAAIDAIYGGR